MEIRKIEIITTEAIVTMIILVEAISPIIILEEEVTSQIIAEIIEATSEEITIQGTTITLVLLELLRHRKTKMPPNTPRWGLTNQTRIRSP